MKPTNAPTRLFLTATTDLALVAIVIGLLLALIVRLPAVIEWASQF